MPIEPASVSKPVVREIEQSSSGASPWNSAQGSSTGGKDRHISSIWEKTISGAQRLFGLDKSNEQAVEEENDKERSSSRDEQTQSALASLNNVPGFSSRGFGRYGFSSDSGGTLLNFGGSTQSKEAANLRADAKSWQESDDSRPIASTGGVGEVEQRDRAVAENGRAQSRENSAREEESDEQKQAKAKAAAAAGRPAPVVPTRPLQTLTSTETAVPQTADAASSRVVPATSDTPTPAAGTAAVSAQPGSIPVAANTAASAKDMTPAGETLARNTSTSDATTSASPVTNSRQVAQTPSAPESSAQKTPQATASPIAAPVSPAAKATDETAATKTRDLEASKPVISDANGSTENAARALESKGAANQPSLAKTTPNDGAELEKSSLSFDPQKAKEAVSESLARQARPLTPPANSTTPAPTSTPATPTFAAAQSLSGEATGPKPAIAESAAPATARPEGLAGEAKDATAADAARKDLAGPQIGRAAAARSADASQSVRQSSLPEQAASDGAHGASGASRVSPQSNASTAGQSNAAAAAASRAAAPVAAANGQGPASTTASATPGLAGVSAGQAPGSPALAAQSQQGGSRPGDPDGGAAKQDFGSTLQSANSSSKGVEKGGDSQQAFDMKTLDGDSTRRAEVVNKTRQSSYVTKTAEEMKEVVAAMSKSVESLATNKGGAMTLKLNFEQGGSMTLRVSMEGGQVSTQMQTDVAGLEAAIKSHWAELATDWNQKGVKLNAPQFQPGAAAHGEGDARSDQWTDLSQRQERNAQSFFGSSGRQGSGRQGTASRQEPASRGVSLDPNGGEATDAPAPAAVGSKPERELKTYA